MLVRDHIKEEIKSLCEAYFGPIDNFELIYNIDVMSVLRLREEISEYNVDKEYFKLTDPEFYKYYCYLENTLNQEILDQIEKLVETVYQNDKIRKILPYDFFSDVAESFYRSTTFGEFMAISENDIISFFTRKIDMYNFPMTKIYKNIVYQDMRTLPYKYVAKFMTPDKRSEFYDSLVSVVEREYVGLFNEKIVNGNNILCLSKVGDRGDIIKFLSISSDYFALEKGDMIELKDNNFAISDIGSDIKKVNVDYSLRMADGSLEKITVYGDFYISFGVGKILLKDKRGAA